LNPASEFVPCHGCGAQVPASSGPRHRYIGASPGCWAIFGEVLARDYGELAMPPEHRFVVDAYAAQHPGQESKQAIRSVAVHLIALHLVLERCWPIHRVPAEMARHTKRPDLYWLSPPEARGAINVLHVHDVQDPAQRAGVCRQWAESVWQAWASHHAQVRTWAES
jgi:hypothetical protein